MEKSIFEKRIRMKDALANLDIVEEVDEELEVYDREVNYTAHQKAVAGLNVEQAEAYKHIIDHIDWMERKVVDDGMQLFVSGTAGTGKSHLINALADELTLSYTTDATRATKPAVLLAAPTGLAAIQIRGSTIHSMLGINVQRGAERSLTALNSAKYAFFSF